MKKITVSIIVAFLIIVSVYAQSPEKISYQAIIRNSTGELIKSKLVGVQISILYGNSNGKVVYSELHNSETNENGLLTLEIGTGVTGYNFSEIAWSTGDYFIKIETDITGGNNYTIAGVSQLLSVPYALYAKEAGNMPDVSGFANITALNDTAASIRSNMFSGNYNELIEKPDLLLMHLNTKAIQDTAFQIRADIPNVSRFVTTGALSDTIERINAEHAKAIADTTLLLLTYIKKLESVLYQVSEPQALFNAGVSIDDIVAYMKDGAIIKNGLVDTRDNNKYSVLKLGSQLWMSDNLAYLPHVHNNSEFISKGSLAMPAYGVYGYNGNDMLIAKANSYYLEYGVLYNWYAVNTDSLCPAGWHVPTDNEWIILETYLSAKGYNYDSTIGAGSSKIAKAMASTVLWNVSTTSGAVGSDLSINNASGFSALPGGYRLGTDGTSHNEGNHAYFWSISESGVDVLSRLISYNNAGVSKGSSAKTLGLSVRCLKD